MNWLEIVKQIFEVIIIPLLGAGTIWLIKFIEAKRVQAKQSTDNALAQKYIDLLTNTIIDCVAATNQTYVEELKKQGTFDLEAQKMAFKKTFDAILNILSEDAITYLSSIFDDLEGYITAGIESTVYSQKLH